jgi:hypothetical protein
MIQLKELPSKAAPAFIFLFGFLGFGQMLVRIEPETEATTLIGVVFATMAVATAAFMLACGVLFFTKLIRNWPPMKGLELP